MRCGVTSCRMPEHAKGLCRSHYGRWERYGDPVGRDPVGRALSPEGVGRVLYTHRQLDLLPKTTVIVAEGELPHVFQRWHDGWYELGAAPEPWWSAQLLHHLARSWRVVWLPVPEVDTIGTGLVH